MKKRIIRTILGIVTVCILGLSACAKGDGGIAGAGKSGDGTEASSSQASASSASQSQAGESRADDGNNSGSNAQSGAENADHATALIPLLMDRETNALAVGTCEWGGRIITDGTVRRDALEARLRSINAELTPEGGVTDVYVTRSDDTAVSLVIVKSADGEEEPAASCMTYVLNPETGKELRLSDIVADMEAFDAIVQDEEEYNWTLDYDGVTVYPRNAPVDDTGNVSCVTVRFDEHKEIFREAYTEHPDSYMIQMLPGRTYAQMEGVEKVGVNRKPVTDTGKAPQYPHTLAMGERTIDIYHVRDYQTFYLVYIGGQGCILGELPQLGTTYLPDSHVMDYYNFSDKEAGGELVRYSLADRGALDPENLRLYDDSFYEMHPAMAKYAINGYGYYSMTADGEFRQKEDFWYLDGPERAAARQIDTLGYRLYDTESLVSKQITRDMPLAPYRTDGKTYFEFVGNGDVFRFEIDGLDESVKLNGTYTFDMLFGT